MTTVEFATTLETLDCAECAMMWAMPGRFIKDRRNDGKTFYCPAGHKNYFGDGEIEKLKKKLASEEQRRQRVEADRDQVKAALRDEKRRLIAQRGQTTKARNKLARVKAGVCPCCDMPFPDLQKHIAAEHPEFTPEKPESDADGDESQVGTPATEAPAEEETPKDQTK